MSNIPPKPPDKEFRASRPRVVVSAAIWSREEDRGDFKTTRHSVQTRRRYYDPDLKEWKEARSFAPEDLPLVILVLSEAHRYITLKEHEPAAERPSA